MERLPSAKYAPSGCVGSDLHEVTVIRARTALPARSLTTGDRAGGRCGSGTAVRTIASPQAPPRVATVLAACLKAIP